MDNGSQYLSEHFQNQLKFWGIAPSFAFVEHPQTNGVVERFFRTLKEQIIYGRIYQTVEDLRVAVDKFVELYNGESRIERLGFLSPKQARENVMCQDIVTRQRGLRRGFKGFDFMSEREEEIDWDEFIQEVRREEEDLFFDFWF